MTLARTNCNWISCSKKREKDSQYCKDNHYIGIGLKISQYLVIVLWMIFSILMINIGIFYNILHILISAFLVVIFIICLEKMYIIGFEQFTKKISVYHFFLLIYKIIEFGTILVKLILLSLHHIFIKQIVKAYNQITHTCDFSTGNYYCNECGRSYKSVKNQ